VSSRQFGYAGDRLAPGRAMRFDPAPRPHRRNGVRPAVITDLFFYVLAIPGVICLGLSKGGFAAAGMIAAPLLSLYIPPLQAAAILLPILIVQDAISVWTYRKEWSAWNLKVLAAGSAIGVCAAWLTAAYVSDNFVRIMVGLIGASFVLNTWLRAATAGASKPTVARGMFWGAVSGFTSTMAQAGGPPFQVFVLPQRLSKMTLVGTGTMFFAVNNVFKIAAYVGLGQFSADGIGTSLVLMPIAVAGNFLGIWLVRVTPTELFYKIAYVMVMLISLLLLWQGTVRILV
jgi:uncharacterized membrane protein YfcA